MGFSIVVALLILTLALLMVTAIETKVATNNERAGGGDTSVGSNDSSEREKELDLSHLDKQRLQAEARKRRLQREREREGVLAAKATLEAANTDQCDWKSQPLSLVKGQVCGIHYKVLGLDRKKEDLDDSDVKKAYRAKSLSLHPDKNPAMEAKNAFKVITDAYECLVDVSCRERYNRELDIAERQVMVERHQFKEMVTRKSLKVLSQVHYYLSIAANQIYDTGMSLWDLAGEIEMPLFGDTRPVGRAIMLAGLLLKGQLLLKIHSVSYLVLRVNYELANMRAQQQDQE